MGKSGEGLFLLLGAICSAFMFLMFYWSDGGMMNALTFIISLIPFILCFSGVMSCRQIDEEEKANKKENKGV